MRANERASVSSASTVEDERALPIEVASQMQNDTKMGAEVSDKQVWKPSVKEGNSTSQLTSLLTEYEEYDGSIMEIESMPLATEKFELEDYAPKKTTPDLMDADINQETQTKMEYLPATVTSSALTDYVIVKGPYPVGLEDNSLSSSNNPDKNFNPIPNGQDNPKSNQDPDSNDLQDGVGPTSSDPDNSNLLASKDLKNDLPSSFNDPGDNRSSNIHLEEDLHPTSNEPAGSRSVTFKCPEDDSLQIYQSPKDDYRPVINVGYYYFISKGN